MGGRSPTLNKYLRSALRELLCTALLLSLEIISRQNGIPLKAAFTEISRSEISLSRVIVASESRQWVGHKESSLTSRDVAAKAMTTARWNGQAAKQSVSRAHADPFKHAWLSHSAVGPTNTLEGALIRNWKLGIYFLESLSLSSNFTVEYELRVPQDPGTL